MDSLYSSIISTLSIYELEFDWFILLRNAYTMIYASPAN